MALHRKYDILAIVVIVFGAVAYASFRTEFRLRATMPVEFFDASKVSPKTRAAEEAIARMYWDCAVRQIQWKYGYARRLPDEAPPEFFITATRVGTGANAPAARALYWQKLRATWSVSSAWEQHYEWNTISLSNSLQSAGAWLERHMRAIIGYS